MSKITRFLTLLGVSALLVGAVGGCGPRGETKSLDEVLSLARDRYQTALEGVNETELRSSLDELSSRLDMMSSTSGSLVSDAKSVSKLLADLTSRAGFTARPALAELSGSTGSRSPRRSSG
ncbi:MAG: hypothetical protein QY326_06350 [Bdellovibrionota bacterium]|nr:MAG: hypothetical protein QY326_06350 [Bdellovibrionota bacterium]